MQDDVSELLRSATREYPQTKVNVLTPEIHHFTSCCERHLPVYWYYCIPAGSVTPHKHTLPFPLVWIHRLYYCSNSKGLNSPLNGTNGPRGREREETSAPGHKSLLALHLCLMLMLLSLASSVQPSVVLSSADLSTVCTEHTSVARWRDKMLSSWEPFTFCWASRDVELHQHSCPI